MVVESSDWRAWRWNLDCPLSEIRWNLAGAHAGRLGVEMGSEERERETACVRWRGMWEM